METGKLKLFSFNLTSRAEKRLSFYLWNGESNETFTGDDRTPAGSENVQNYSVCAIIFHLLQCKYKNISLKGQSHKLVNTIFCFLIVLFPYCYRLEKSFPLDFRVVIG